MNVVNWGCSPLPFIPGLRLCEAFYRKEVGPLLERFFPGQLHTAGLIGYGSDVLGYDTPMSRDHMWGPRLILLLPEEGFEIRSRQITQCLRENLPLTFCGYPTHFGAPDGEGVRIMQPLDRGPVEPLIFIHTLAEFLRQELGADFKSGLSTVDWLMLPEQRLLQVTGGGVFHDDLGLEQTRQRLSYFPRDIWLYLLACQWSRIGQEEPFVGRCGQAGDDLGSRLVAARLAHDLMRLGFLMERRYAPYSKWFGTAFSRLEISSLLSPILERALAAEGWQAREAALVEGYQLCARRHNDLGLTHTLDVEAVNFHGRPFRVLFADRFAAALRDRIEDPALCALPPYGSVSQFCSTTDLLESPPACRRLVNLYQEQP